MSVRINDFSNNTYLYVGYKTKKNKCMVVFDFSCNCDTNNVVLYFNKVFRFYHIQRVQTKITRTQNIDRYRSRLDVLFSHFCIGSYSIGIMCLCCAMSL